jgi:hypothetical protein
MNAVVKEETFEEAIKQHLVENRDRLVKNAVDHAMVQMAESMKYGAYSKASEQMDKFFKEEVGPAIAEYLKSQKESLIAQTVALVKQTIDEGMKSYAECLMKDMKDDYKRGERIASLLGIKTSRY